VLSVDIPSGLDCDTGEVLGVCVRAARTVTFILPKVGFAKADGPAMCGEITVADIGVPPPA
jgi:NAD(P)H-hydrate epimerase